SAKLLMASLGGFRGRPPLTAARACVLLTGAARNGPGPARPFPKPLANPFDPRQRGGPVPPLVQEFDVAILLTCTCGKKLKIDDRYAGKQGRCPACGGTLDIPSGEHRG